MSVIDRVDRGQVLDARDLEAEVGGDIGEVSLGDRPGPRVADRVERVGGGRLDLLEVVVAAAHLVAHRGVGGTGAPSVPTTAARCSGITRAVPLRELLNAVKER